MQNGNRGVSLSSPFISSTPPLFTALACPDTVGLPLIYRWKILVLLCEGLHPQPPASRCLPLLRFAFGSFHGTRHGTLTHPNHAKLFAMSYFWLSGEAPSLLRLRSTPMCAASDYVRLGISLCGGSSGCLLLCQLCQLLQTFHAQRM